MTYNHNELGNMDMRLPETEQLYGQIQKHIDGAWIDIHGLCYPDSDWAFTVATAYDEKHGDYRVDIRDHPEGVPV